MQKILCISDISRECSDCLNTALVEQLTGNGEGYPGILSMPLDNRLLLQSMSAILTIHKEVHTLCAQREKNVASACVHEQLNNWQLPPTKYDPVILVLDTSFHSCSLSMMVDQSVFESPFGFALFFPSGLFPTDLFVGGVPHSHTDLLYAGTTWDGFKGQLEEIRVNGRALDFSENLAAAAVTVVGGDDSEGTRGQNGCDFHFSGLASYAEFGMTLGFLFNPVFYLIVLFFQDALFPLFLDHHTT